MGSSIPLYCKIKPGISTIFILESLLRPEVGGVFTVVKSPTVHIPSQNNRKDLFSCDKMMLASGF